MSDAADRTKPALLVGRKPQNIRKRVTEEEPTGEQETKITRRQTDEEPVEEQEARTTRQQTEEEQEDKMTRGQTEELTSPLTDEPEQQQQQRQSLHSPNSPDAEQIRDHRTVRETAALLHKESLQGNYLGQANYYQYRTQQDTVRANALSDKNFRAGPQRIATTIRTTCRFDYAPDLCKDYNETGFCGFGDSCKFVHDRGDYKSGWELDAEWEAQQRALALGQTAKGEEDYEIREAEQPAEPEQTTCAICKGDLFFNKQLTVETKCGHRFHEKCALAHSRQSKRCAICSAPVDGQFKIIKASSSSVRK